MDCGVGAVELARTAREVVGAQLAGGLEVAVDVLAGLPLHGVHRYSGELRVDARSRGGRIAPGGRLDREGRRCRWS